MSVRTRIDLVQAILGNDYDGTTDLTPYIKSASIIVDRVVTVAATKVFSSTLSSDEQEIIERWLSAHVYCQMEKTLTSTSTGGASGSYSGQTGQGFESTLYGQMALRLDYSGVLRNLDKQQRAGGVWLGKVPSEQIPVEQRD